MPFFILSIFKTLKFSTNYKLALLLFYYLLVLMCWYRARNNDFYWFRLIKVVPLIILKKAKQIEFIRILEFLWILTSGDQRPL